MNKSLIVIICTVISIHYTSGFADSIVSSDGAITDGASDNEKLYFFEIDTSTKSSTWIHDTRLKVYDESGIRNLSNELFIHPTELRVGREYLYFAVLSDSCIKEVYCNYQDIIRMSKTDGDLEVLARDLKSAVHISIGENILYVSESDGKIWKINKDGLSLKLLFQTRNIIMDLVSEQNEIYWIEEISDQNNMIMNMREGSQPKLIADNIKIPYELKVKDGMLYWNEIDIKSTEGSFADFTSIMVYDQGKIKKLAEFKNTSPVSIHQPSSHYSSYLVSDNFVYFANNTDTPKLIQRMYLENGTIRDITSIEYDAKFLRTDENFLYVIGKYDDAFVIDKIALSVVIPEFPYVLVVILAAFSYLILWNRLRVSKFT